MLGCLVHPVAHHLPWVVHCVLVKGWGATNNSLVVCSLVTESCSLQMPQCRSVCASTSQHPTTLKCWGRPSPRTTFRGSNTSKPRSQPARHPQSSPPPLHPPFPAPPFRTPQTAPPSATAPTTPPQRTASTPGTGQQLKMSATPWRSPKVRPTWWQVTSSWTSHGLPTTPAGSHSKKLLTTCVSQAAQACPPAPTRPMSVGAGWSSVTWEVRRVCVRLCPSITMLVVPWSSLTLQPGPPSGYPSRRTTCSTRRMVICVLLT